MKRIFSFFAAILFAASMMAGVGNEYYNVTFLKSSGPSGYDKTGDYAYGGITWTIPGNITNGDYIRVGGKGINYQERYIFSQAPLNDAIAKIVIAHNGKSRANVTLHTVTVVVASDADFTEDVVTTEYEVGEDEIQKNTEGEIVIVPAPTIVSWATGSYYKFIFTVSNPDSSNGGIDVMSITFFSYQDDDAAAINASNIDLGLISTTELPFSVEKELVVTGANLSSPISYETDGEHLSLSGTLTAEGGSLIVTITAAEEGEIDEIITLTSDDVETIVSVKANIIKTDGDGSQDNPFSASDVVKLNNNYGNEKAWVMGYIVGCAASGGQIATSATNSNIAIGDATDQTENVVPVQLPNNDIRAALNIVDNPSNVGRQVKVFGQLIAYFSFTGVQNVSDYEFVGDAPITVAKPVITPEEATFTEPITVSITCATEGASIHFTLDGTDPTENSEEYSEPFEISETTTVKAIAFLEDVKSAIATMTYTLVDPSALISCAEVYGLDDNTEAKLNEVTVTYVSGKNVWVKDASGAVFLFMKSSASFAAGAKLQGVVGTKKLYSGLVEIELNADQQAAIEATAGEAPAPEELTAAIDEAKDMSKYVLLKDVTVAEGSFTTSSSTSLNMTFAGVQVALYNKFKLAATFAASKTYNVIGLVSKHNSDLQVNFISAEEAGVAPVTVAKPTFEPTGTTFTESITVSITCETEGATIRYTLDGTDPTANSFEYSEPFEISETTTVKAIAFLDDAQSDIASITYTKKADPVVPGDCYTLTFTYYDKTDGDGGAKLNTKEAIFDEASQDYIDEVLVGTQVYAGRKYKDVASGDSIFSNLKLGTGTAAAQLKFALANPTEVEKIIFRAAMYSDTEGAEGFTVNDSEPFALSGGKLVFADYEWIPEGEVSTIDINQVKANKGRFYLTSITICPKSDSGEPAIKASDIDLGEVKTEDDVYETELTLEVKGENLDSPIAFESSNSELVAVSGQLDETGGTLTVNISVPATEEGTVLNETITLTSGNVVKEVAVTAIVKKVVPVIPTGGFVKVTEALNDWEGTYLIVYEEGSVALDGSLENLDAVGNVKAVTITEGTIEATEEMLAIAFTVTADADNEGWYQLKSASGYYIAGTKASANASNGLKSSNDEEAKSEYLNQPGVDEMLSKSADQNMTLRFNKASNQNRFRYYKSNQEPIALYKLTEESGEPAILAANIALGEIETEKDVYEDELTLRVTGKNLESPIAFESSNSEIVAVSGQLDETGGTLTVNIAVPATEEGTVLDETITLTSGDVVKVVSVTAVVKQVVPVPPTGKKYILADIENIAPDQSVIIAMETNYGAKAAVNVFALSIPENASTAPAAVSVTAEDDAIVTDEENIFWNIVKDEDGNYIIYPAGTTETWLYCTTSNNGVRVGNSSTATAKTFDIQQAAEDKGGGMYLHNIGNNRYLGIYNSQDWRCYETVNNNIKNQNLRLYVYSGTTAIDNTEVMEKATKFIQNGHLFIIKGDRIYNVMGQIIR